MAATATSPGPRSRWLRRVLAEAIRLGTLALLVAAVYLTLVIGLGRPPTAGEGTLLILSAAAAAVCALLWVPMRSRVDAITVRLLQGERDSADEALRVFGHRLTRALPTDELLLQLAETLRRTLGLRAAEVWTGANGLLERTVADPARDGASVLLTAGEESVLGRAGVVGQAWLGVWLPQLVDGREAAVLRVAPATNAGELLGLIIVERAPGVEDFRVEEERLLADLARQLALALRNVHLDSALQASLAELRLQAEELRASRARVVTAADAERRRIERDLHDGAQQQLVGLLVNLRLARELADSKPAEAAALLESLRADAKEALEELQELAHGIYPPLLADRGLAEALRAVAARAGTPTRVEAAAAGRYPPDVEATVYFCCLEALQNAAKHAGPGARATLRVWEEQRTLRFEVADDGAGFEPGRRPRGAGLSNMGDRLGALGGHLSLSATPGRGTSVSGTVPLEP